MIAQFISQHASQLVTLDLVLAVATALVVFYTCGVAYYEAGHADLSVSGPARHTLVKFARNWLLILGINLAFVTLFTWLRMDAIAVVLVFNMVRVVFQAIYVYDKYGEVASY